MKKLKITLKKIWSAITEHYLDFTVIAPVAVGILLIFAQGFGFAFTGEWPIPAMQLFIGCITSILFSGTVFKIRGLYNELKKITNANR